MPTHLNRQYWLLHARQDQQVLIPGAADRAAARRAEWPVTCQFCDGVRKGGARNSETAEIKTLIFN